MYHPIWMSTQRRMHICFLCPFCVQEGPGGKNLSLHSHGFLCFQKLWFSPLDSLASCLLPQLFFCFPWWVELANSQDKFDGDVWTWSWEPVQHHGLRHQLLLQLYNVLHSAELLLALCPGSLVLSLHSCFSLTNSVLVPPLGMSGPFLWQL